MKTKAAYILAVVAALFLFGSLSTPAFAQKKPNTPEIQKFESMGGKLLYLGKSYDMDSWMFLKRNGEPHMILYVSPAGAMVRGRLFGPGGKDVTKTQLEIYKRRMDSEQGAVDIPENADKDAIPISEQFYAAVEKKANWVRVGPPDAPYVYVFINVDCEHCQSLYRTFKGSLEKGMLQMRIIPTGEQENNLYGGAAMLSVEDGGKAWAEYMDGKRGALDRTLIKGDAMDRLKVNNKLAQQWKLPQIPFTIYRKVSDGTIMVLPGQPSNPMLIMPDLVKLGENK